MSNGTYLSTGITTIPDTHQFSYNIFSHRSLFKNKYSGTWGFGLGSNFDFHFFMLSLTSLQKNLPKITMKCSLGADTYPFRISIQHDLSSSGLYHHPWTRTTTLRKTSPKSFYNHGKSHRGELSLGLSTTADVELRLTSTRTLSRFCNLSLGLQHTSSKGLTWLIKVSRGETSFTVPIILTLTSSANYWIKALCVSLWTVLLDMSIQDWVHHHDDGHLPSIIEPMYTYPPRQGSSKNRDQALKEQRLMVKAAASKREHEVSLFDKSGLVILKAVYEDPDGETLDVTTALQCWVVDSRLTLNSGSKKSLLGFYDVTPPHRKEEDSRSWWQRVLQISPFVSLSPTRKVNNGPSLTIRYRTSDGVFELVIRDESALELPHPHALKLGGSNIF
jgi:hypothetical protein